VRVLFRTPESARLLRSPARVWLCFGQQSFRLPPPSVEIELQIGALHDFCAARLTRFRKAYSDFKEQQRERRRAAQPAPKAIRWRLTKVGDEKCNVVGAPDAHIIAPPINSNSNAHSTIELC